MYTINLTHFDDIQPVNGFNMPDSWRLTKDMRLAVNLKNGGTGELVLKSEFKPGCWRAEWDRVGSPLHGRIFELGKEGFSDIVVTAAPGLRTPTPLTWPSRITLAS